MVLHSFEPSYFHLLPGSFISGPSLVCLYFPKLSFLIHLETFFSSFISTESSPLPCFSFISSLFKQIFYCHTVKLVQLFFHHLLFLSYVKFAQSPKIIFFLNFYSSIYGLLVKTRENFNRSSTSTPISIFFFNALWNIFFFSFNSTHGTINN